MVKITVLKVKNSEFFGELEDAVTGQTLKVEGDFYVDWDDDIAVPQIENVFISDSSEQLSMASLDIEDAEHQIAQFDDGSWAEDRVGRMIDRAYDLMRDGE